MVIFDLFVDIMKLQVKLVDQGFVREVAAIILILTSRDVDSFQDLISRVISVNSQQVLIDAEEL